MAPLIFVVAFAGAMATIVDFNAVECASVSLSTDEVTPNSLHSAIVNQSFRGYKVLRAVPEDSDGVDTLKNLVSNTLLDFWTYPTAVLVPVDIMTPPEELQSLENTLREKVSLLLIS
jgi:hypothetical protein